MSRRDDLIALRDAVHAGTFTYGHFLSAFKDNGGKPPDHHPILSSKAFAACKGSVDAALTLLAAVLPGWNVTCLDQACNLAGDPWGAEVSFFDGSNPGRNRKHYSGHNFSTPARALLLATLNALIAESDT